MFNPAVLRPLTPRGMGTDQALRPLTPRGMSMDQASRPLTPRGMSMDQASRPLTPRGMGTDQASAASGPLTPGPLTPRGMGTDQAVRPLTPRGMGTNKALVPLTPRGMKAQMGTRPMATGPMATGPTARGLMTAGPLVTRPISPRPMNPGPLVTRPLTPAGRPQKEAILAFQEKIRQKYSHLGTPSQMLQQDAEPQKPQDDGSATASMLFSGKMVKKEPLETGADGDDNDPEKMKEMMDQAWLEADMEDAMGMVTEKDVAQESDCADQEKPDGAPSSVWSQLDNVLSNVLSNPKGESHTQLDIMLQGGDQVPPGLDSEYMEFLEREDELEEEKSLTINKGASTPILPALLDAVIPEPDDKNLKSSFPCQFGRKCKRPECYYAHPEGREADENKELFKVSEFPCQFGRKCKRSGCYFAHPEGREADENRNLLNTTDFPCKFGKKCKRPGCYFTHPPGRQLDKKSQASANQPSSKVEAIKPPGRVLAVKNEADDNSVAPQPPTSSASTGPEPLTPGPLTPGRMGVAPAPPTSSASTGPEPLIPGRRKLAPTTTNTPTKSSADFPCQFGAQCIRPGCYYAHPQGRVLDGTASAATADVTSATPCKFGKKCIRPGCYYTHPEGREVDDNPNAASTGATNFPCKFGKRCTRPGCYYMHPEGREVDGEVPAAKRQRVDDNADASAEEDPASAVEDPATAEENERRRGILAQQVQNLQKISQEIGAAWAKYCAIEGKKYPWSKGSRSLDPAQCSLVFLAEFLHSQQIVPDTTVMENEMLLMDLQSATSIEEVLDAYDNHQEGLDGLTISLSLCLVCKFHSSKKKGSDADARVNSLIETACERANEFSAQQLVQSISALSSLDAAVFYDNVKLLAEAALSLQSDFQPEDVARIQSAFLKLLAPTEMREAFALIGDIVAPQFENVPALELVQILKS